MNIFNESCESMKEFCEFNGYTNQDKMVFYNSPV